ncbi:MAG: IS5 family transposase [Thermodesulfovibrionales bacterium]|nr:IS5 family transposase [Thermodesulfovibrionales bacterium]
MKQAGMFEMDNRMGKIDCNGDPLVKHNEVIGWEMFRPELERIRQKARKSNAGRKPYDIVLMFKVLVIQSLYNLADDAVEFQILDRLSFMRFLGLSIGDSVPDAKTVWLFREELREAGVIEKLFARLDRHLRDNGFSARKGQIIDASIVAAPVQRNTRQENGAIKEGLVPDGWSEEKLRQKDTDARWTKKGGRSFFGYKNHVCVDAKHKLIRGYEVTDASVHDSRVFVELLDEDNMSRDVWADAAYRSEDAIESLEADGYREHIQRKGVRGKELTEWEKQGNRKRARVRSRIEHVFGVQAKRAGSLIVRTIGIWRARANIGLRNMAYNLDRYGTLAKAKA